MTTARRFASTFVVAGLAAAVSLVVLAPSMALADDATGKVATHATSHPTKGNIPQSVPVEAGLGLSLCSAIVALGMGRRSRW